jgi:hypothetical protein
MLLASGTSAAGASFALHCGERARARDRSWPRCLSVLVVSAMVTSAQGGEAEPGTCKLAPPTLARLGYRTLPAELSRADLQSLKGAKKALARKELASAKKALDPLAAKYSEDPEVRYLLAAIRATEGAFAEACGDVAWLLELDLVAFAQRFEKDSAFEKLRASADGTRLQQHVQALTPLWRQAALDGVPAMLSRGSRGGQEIWHSHYLRGGVYLHETGRFLPLEPGVEGANAVLVHPKAGTAAVVKFRVEDCRSDHCPRLGATDLLVFRLGEWSRPPSRWRYGENGTMADMLDLRTGAQGTAIRVHDCNEGPQCLSPWETVGGKSASPNKPADVEMSMTVGFRGSLLGITPAGEQVRKGRLISGTTDVQLDPQHADATAIHDILVDRTIGTRLVLSTVDRCDCASKREGAILRHVLSKVDAQGKATVVLGGKGPATALLDGKQAVYLQTGDTVRRWSSMAAVGAEAGTPIMSGVVLAVPVSERGNCCGL